MTRVLVLACGEPMRGDDGVSSAVLEALPPSALARAEVRVVGQLMPDDLAAADGPAIVLDAVEGAAPGAIVDLPLRSLLDPRFAGMATASSHLLPLPMSVAIADVLAAGRLRGRFIGIAAEAYEIGTPLSPAVRTAVSRCAARLAAWIDGMAEVTEDVPCA